MSTIVATIVATTVATMADTMLATMAVHPFGYPLGQIATSRYHSCGAIAGPVPASPNEGLASHDASYRGARA